MLSWVEYKKNYNLGARFRHTSHNKWQTQSMFLLFTVAAVPFPLFVLPLFVYVVSVYVLCCFVLSIHLIKPLTGALGSLCSINLFFFWLSPYIHIFVHQRSPTGYFTVGILHIVHGFVLASVAQLNVHPTGDQEVADSIPAGSGTFFRGDWSWNIVYGHSLPSADSRRAVVSFWRKNVHKYWLTT